MHTNTRLQWHWGAACALSFVVAALLLSFGRPAQAHVLIPDNTEKIGAILHLSPDDDPVARKLTGIHFEVQASIDLKKSAANMVVESGDGGIKETIPAVTDGTAVFAQVVFPLPGLYYVTLVIDPPGSNPASSQPRTFRTAVQVTRIANGTKVTPHVPEWAKVGLVLTQWLMAALVLIIIGRRKRIIKQSR